MIEKNNEFIQILNYAEREQLKEFDYAKNADWANYHRFLEGYGEVGADGVERISKNIAPSFADYCSWRKKYKGWSCGMITRNRSCWIPEFVVNLPEPNLWILQNSKRKRVDDLPRVIIEAYGEKI